MRIYHETADFQLHLVISVQLTSGAFQAPPAVLAGKVHPTNAFTP